MATIPVTPGSTPPTPPPVPAPKPAAAAPTPTPNKPGLSGKTKKIIYAAIVVVVLAAGGGAYWYLKLRQPTKPATTAAPKATTPAKTETIDPILARFIKPTTGETWLATPKALNKLGYITGDDEKQTTYYEVGKHGDNTILMSDTIQMGDSVFLYEKTPAGKVTAIVRPDSQAVYKDDEEKYYTQLFRSSITVDKNSHYDSLSIPPTLDVGNGYKTTKLTFPSLGRYLSTEEVASETTGGQKFSTVKTLGGSTLQKVERPYTDTQLTSISYRVKLPINTAVELNFDPLDTDLAKYQWSTGLYTNDKLKSITEGCGNFSAAVTKSSALSDNDVETVGKSGTSETIYRIKDTNNPLFTKAYDEFHTYVQDVKDDPNHDITKTQFQDEHGLIIYKDKSGQFLVYVREQLAPAYGCAKPVVYLYPTHDQLVNVKVGADVKISDPVYDPIKGWQSVLARPNGQLTVGGKNYNSLFWEGPGLGVYPAINSGTVVKTSDAPKVIQRQLAQLGLNQREIADFSAYWDGKLPSQPYTRLTWLNTAQMNQLAPLVISPKPETLIRVFLDADGLDAPIKLPSQKLTSLPRKGFTVVEWGGLARFKLGSK